MPVSRCAAGASGSLPQESRPRFTTFKQPRHRSSVAHGGGWPRCRAAPAPRHRGGVGVQWLPARISAARWRAPRHGSGPVRQYRRSIWPCVPPPRSPLHYIATFIIHIKPLRHYFARRRRTSPPQVGARISRSASLGKIYTVHEEFSGETHHGRHSAYRSRQ